MLRSARSIRRFVFAISWILLPVASFWGGNETPNNSTVHVEMRNVLYHFTAAVAAHVSYLHGELLSTAPGAVPSFDDPRSFRMILTNAKVSIDAPALGEILNQYVFGADDSPLRHVSVETSGDLLKIKGRLHSKGDVPFENGRKSLAGVGQ